MMNKIWDKIEKAKAFGLALQTVTPQLKSVLDIVHGQMMRINSLSIQSCEKAAALVGGLWPKTDASKQLYCSTKGLGIGRFDDWAQARQGCGTSSGQESVAQQPDKRFEHIGADKMNVVWDALKASGLFDDDPMWKEVFLSITGTIVRDEQGRTLHFPSLCQSQDWIKRFMRGGALSVYRCSDDRCLKLNKQVVEIEDSLYSKLYALCASIESKIKQGVALDNHEKAIVKHSRVPVLKFMTINAFAYDEVMPHHEIVEVLAFDLVMRWVEEVLRLVEDSVQHMRSVQIDDTLFKLFVSQVRKTRIILAETHQGFYRYVRSVGALIDRAKIVEKKALSYGYHVLSM